MPARFQSYAVEVVLDMAGRSGCSVQPALEYRECGPGGQGQDCPPERSRPVGFSGLQALPPAVIQLVLTAGLLPV